MLTRKNMPNLWEYHSFGTHFHFPDQVLGNVLFTWNLNIKKIE
jgi:hypothetical protein